MVTMDKKVKIMVTKERIALPFAIDTYPLNRIGTRYMIVLRFFIFNVIITIHK